MTGFCGEVFCVLGGKNLLQGAASRSFCGWDAVRDYTLHECRTLFAYKSGAKPHHIKNSHLPIRQKTSPKSTRAMQSESNLRHVRAGALGGSSREVREVWRVGTPLRKRGSCASKVFLTPSDTAPLRATRGNRRRGRGLTRFSRLSRRREHGSASQRSRACHLWRDSRP